VIWGLLILGLEALSLLGAAFDLVRARHWPALIAATAKLYLLAAIGDALLTAAPRLWPLTWLGERWWLSLLALPALSFAAMVLAWRARNELPGHDPVHGRLDRAGLVFLANGLADTAIVVLGIAGVYVTQSSGVG